MRNEKKLLQLLQRTSEPDDQLFREGKYGFPVVFVDLETLTATDAIDMIVAEPVVVMPLVCEVTYVPAPEEIQ